MRKGRVMRTKKRRERKKRKSKKRKKRKRKNWKEREERKMSGNFPMIDHEKYLLFFALPPHSFSVLIRTTQRVLTLFFFLSVSSEKRNAVSLEP
jgi:hypothetical protein